jgi:uncharacterized protein VirK/YbjX
MFLALILMNFCQVLTSCWFAEEKQKLTKKSTITIIGQQKTDFRLYLLMNIGCCPND